MQADVSSLKCLTALGADPATMIEQALATLKAAVAEGRDCEIELAGLMIPFVYTPGQRPGTVSCSHEHFMIDTLCAIEHGLRIALLYGLDRRRPA